MNKIVSIGILTLSFMIAIYSYIVLPETVVVQLDISGSPSNFVPKIIAVMIPLALSIGGVLGHYFSRGTEKKYLGLSVIGIFVMLITVVFNVCFY